MDMVTQSADAPVIDSHGDIAVRPADPREDFIGDRPSGRSLLEIEALAEAIARRLGYVPGQDYLSAIRSLGGDVVMGGLAYSDWHERSNLRVGERDSVAFTITLPPRTSAEQDRAIVARALGHYVLHRLDWRQGKGDPRRDTPSMQATIFALAFLMPADDFRRIYEKSNGSIPLLVSYFGVDRDQVVARAKRLALVTPPDH